VILRDDRATTGSGRLDPDIWCQGILESPGEFPTIRALGTR